MEKPARVQLIVADCIIAETFGSHDEAYDGINSIINRIEDRYSPDLFRADGRSKNRLYGPSKDYMNSTEFEGLVEYVHTAHFTRIYKNGAFMIVDLRGRVFVDKPGTDGGFCPR